MPDRTAITEELLDQWLDALNESGLPPAPPAAIAGLAEVALEYRRVLAPSGNVAAAPERNGKMHHAPTLATSNGTSWRILAQPRPQKVSWSSWLATVAVLALLVGLIGGAAVRTWGIPGASDPTHFAGVAASPGASPAAGTLSCGAPGYAPVVSGDVTAPTDVDLGGPPIERGDGWTMVPTDGTSRTLPGASYPIEGAPGAYISPEGDGNAKVISTTLDETWSFPAISEPAGSPGVMARPTVSAYGPFIVGAARDDGTDWTIIDLRTGDSISTRALLAETLPGAVVPVQTYAPDRQSDRQAVQFVRASAVPKDGTMPLQPTPTAEASTRAERAHDTVAVILPGSLDDAAVVDVSDISGAYGPTGQSTVVFDPERHIVAWRGWSASETGKPRFGFSIADEDDPSTSMTFVPVDTPAVALPIAFSPDGATLYVLEDNGVTAISEADGTRTPLAFGGGKTTQPVSIAAVNTHANTVLVSQSNRMTWLLDTASGDLRHLPDLDGYMLAPYGDPGVAIGSRYDLGTPGSGEGSSQTVELVDTATGAVVATNTERTVDSTVPWLWKWAALGERYVAELDPEPMMIQVTDRSNGRSWTMALPEADSDAFALANLDDGANSMHITLSPDETCLVLNVDRETGREGNAVFGVITTEHIGTWIAPTEPDATWTELPFELMDWWRVPTDEPQTLPAQDFATPTTFAPDVQVAGFTPLNLRERPATDAEIVNNLPAGTPLVTLSDAEIDDDGGQWVRVRTEGDDEGWVMIQFLEPYGATATPPASPDVTAEGGELSCASPGYVPVVRGAIDPDVLASIGVTNPIVRGDTTTITAANGAEIVFGSDERWTVFPSSNVLLSGHQDEEDLSTVTSLATGQSWTFPTTTGQTGSLSGNYLMVGPWLFGPADETATDWRVINTETGQERLTSDIFGAPFEGTSQMSVTGPWGGVTDGPLLVDFLRVDTQGPGMVLPSSDLDDAWALGEEHAEAGFTGMITSDGARIAYLHLDEAGGVTVRVLDGFSGQQLAEHSAPDAGGDVLQPVGLTAGDGKMILRDSQRVWTVDLATGEIATVFDPGGDIHDFSFDPSTGTAIAISGDDAFTWLDPATGASKSLDMPVPMRFPKPQFGWALIQARDDIAVDYALLDMTTGEIVTEPIGADRDENSTNAWITGGDETGVFIVQAESGRMLVLDGPGGQAFALAAPEAGRDGWAGVSIGVSPNGGCLVYTEGGEGDAPGTSWIAPIEPDAEWTELPFELGPWIEMPPALKTQGATPAATEGPPISTDTPSGDADAGPLLPTPTPVPEVTADPDIVSLLPDDAIPIVATDDPASVDQHVFATVGGVGPDSPPGVTIPLRTGEMLELPDASAIAQIPLAPAALVTNDDGSRLTIDLTSGDTLVDSLPPSVEGEHWVGHYLFFPNDDGTIWRVIDLLTGDQTDTATLGDGPFDRPVTIVPVPSPADAPRNIVIQFAFETSAGDLMPWQGLATDIGPPSGTLVIPGGVDAARFLDGSMGSTDPLHPVVAISGGDVPRVVYTTPKSAAVLVLEDAISGEEIATWSSLHLNTRMHPIYLAGFSADGERIVAWLGFGGYGPAFIHELSWSDDGPKVVSADMGRTHVQQVIGTGDAVIAAVLDEPEAGGSGTAGRWKLIDLESGDATDLPRLDGMLPQPHVPGDEWVVLSSVDDPRSVRIVIVDAASGEVAAQLDDTDLGTATTQSSSRDGGVLVVTGHTGEEHTAGYVIDAASGEAWELEPPFDGQVWYGISPDGSLLTASTAGGDGWVAPAAKGAAWIPLPEGGIVDWLILPDGGG